MNFKTELLKFYNSRLCQRTLSHLHKFIYYTKLDNFFAKRGDKAAYFVLIPLNKVYRKDDKIRVKRNGIIYILNRSDYAQWLIFSKVKDYGPDILIKLLASSQDGNIFDVGANVGMISLRLAQFLLHSNKSHKIYSFEPNPSIFQILNRNVLENVNMRQFIELNNKGLSDSSGSFYINFNPNHSGCGSISSINDYNYTKELITVDTIDDFVDKLSLKSLELIKIDVEGFELNVLKGGERSIIRFEPIFYIEINQTALRYNNTIKEEIVNYLTNRKYVILVPLDDITIVDYFLYKERDSKNLYDIIAIPPHKMELVGNFRFHK